MTVWEPPPYRFVVGPYTATDRWLAAQLVSSGRHVEAVPGRALPPWAPGRVVVPVEERRRLVRTTSTPGWGVPSAAPPTHKKEHKRTIHASCLIVKVPE